MLGLGTRAALILTTGTLALASGVVAVVYSRWQVAVIAALVLLWLSLVVLTYHQQRTAGALRALNRRTKSLAEAAEAAQDAERRTRKRSLGKHLELVRGAISARLDGIEASLSTAARSLETTAGSMSERSLEKSDLLEAVERIEGFARSMHDVGSLPVQDRPHHELITQIDAMLQLRRRFPLDGPAPLMWGWALSPRGLLQAVDLAVEGCDLVVECGSGTSTVYIGRALRDAGRGRLVAIEHLPEIADRVRSDVLRHGLEDVVEVRIAELVDHQVGEETYPWYDAKLLDDLEAIDLLLVDGPPSTTGELARFPALSILGSKLRSGATVLLDDAQRADEKRIAKRWLTDPRLERVSSTTRDQIAFRWSSPPGAWSDMGGTEAAGQ